MCVIASSAGGHTVCPTFQHMVITMAKDEETATWVAAATWVVAAI